MDALSDESKAVAINDLVTRIQELTRATAAATQNLNRVRGERAALNNSTGLTGFLARRISDNRVARARTEAASMLGDLQAARLRMVNLTGSRITNFRRGRGESELDAINRLGDLNLAYRTALGEAQTSGALAGQNFIGRREVNATTRQFLLNPNGRRFQQRDPDRAAETVRGFFGGQMQRFANLGARYFSMANPMMQRIRPFFGRGGFAPMAGLRAMGPLGQAASTAIVIGKQAYNYQRGVHANIQRLENEALLSGLGRGTLSSYGIALGAFGGDRQGAARLSGGIANTLGGMRYGRGGGNLVEAAKMFGLNIMGSGYGGLATTEEILRRMSGLMEHADSMQKEQLVFMASQLGLSADQVRLMKNGPKMLERRLNEFRYITDRLNTPESVAAAEEAGVTAAEMNEAWNLAKQRAFSENGLSAGLNRLGTGFANAINGANGPISGTMRTVGQGMSSLAAVAASLGSSIVSEIGEFFGADMSDYDMSSFVDMMKMKRKENEEEGNSFMSAVWGGLETFGSLFTTEGPFTHQMKNGYDTVIPNTVSGGGGDYIYIQPEIKVEANVSSNASTMTGTGEDLGRATGRQIESSIRRAMAPGVIGMEK